MTHVHQGKAVLFDLDHVLSDASRRDHMLEACYARGNMPHHPDTGATLWDQYHADAWNDQPCHDLVELLSAFRHCDHPVVGITARPGKWRLMTTHWMMKHKIFLEEILMRPDEDFRPSAELKLALARERFGAKISDHVLFIIDDHPEVVKAFQAEGVTALQVWGRKYG